MTPALEDLLPHRPPMLLLDGVDGDGAFLRVAPGAWYADAEGAMPGWFGLEVMAQATAACPGAEPEDGTPRSGYLVGTRSYRSVPSFPAGALLRVKVRLVEADESGLCAFDCAILLHDAVAATATLKVMRS